MADDYTPPGQRSYAERQENRIEKIEDEDLKKKKAKEDEFVEVNDSGNVEAKKSGNDSGNNKQKEQEKTSSNDRGQNQSKLEALKNKAQDLKQNAKGNARYVRTKKRIKNLERKTSQSEDQGSNTQDSELDRGLIGTGLYPGTTKEKTQDFEESVKEDDLTSIESEKKLDQKLVAEDPTLLLDPERKEKTKNFVKNVQAQDKAEQRKQELNQKIEKLEKGPSKENRIERLEDRKQELINSDKYQFSQSYVETLGIDEKKQEIKESKGFYTVETEEGSKTVSKDQAIDKLEQQKQNVNKVISTAEQNKEILVTPRFTEKTSKEQDLNVDTRENQDSEKALTYSRNPKAQQRINRKQEKLGNQLMTEKERNQLNSEINSLQRKARTPASFPGYSRIEGQKASFGALPEKQGYNDLDFSSQSDTPKGLENAELNEFSPKARFVRSLQVLSTTPEGFSAYGSLADPEKSFSDVVSEGSKNLAQDKSPAQESISFIQSPAGLVATGGIGKVAGAGVKGLQAYGVGTGTAGKILGKTAQVGGLGLVGYETAQGVSKIQKGKVSEGTGDILRVGAEAGVFTRGFQKASKKYGPQLARTTKVSQKNTLRQVDPEDSDKFLVGSGEMTAETTIKQRVPLKGGDPEDLKNVDTAVSQADYKIVADRQGSEAQGTIQDRVLSGSPTEKEFQSLSTVKAREGDQFIQQTGDVVNNYRPGEDELVSKTMLRTEKEGRLLRSFQDTSRTSISRKEGEAPISEIRGYSLKAQVRNNVQAKNIRFSGYSRDQDGEIISKTENLVFSKSKSGDVTGGSGQGLEYGNKYGDGFIQETQRQSRGAQQFGSRSRQTAREQLDSGSQVQAVSTTGGSQAEGSQTGISQEFAVSPGGTETRQETRDQGTIQETRNIPEAQVSKRAGQELKEDLGIKSIQRSGRNTQGARTRTQGKPSTIRQNKNVQDLNQETRTREDVIQGTGQVQLQKPGQLQRKRQVGKLKNTQLRNQKVKAVKLTKLQTQFETQSLQPVGITSTPSTIQTTPGGLLMDLDLQAGVTGDKTRTGSQGTNKETNSGIKLSILSANRSELETGSKTFNINMETASKVSKSSFSGGLKTEESKNLGRRKYKSNNEVEFY